MTMEITITRFYNEEMAIANGYIEKDEWINYIKASEIIYPDDEIKIGKNPLTGEIIKISPQPDRAYFIQNEKKVKLQYDDGDIFVECEPTDNSKKILIQLARDQNAVIINRDKEILKW